MKLGTGYYTPEKIIARWEKALKRRNLLRVEWLKGLYIKAMKLEGTGTMARGWRTKALREARIEKMKELRNTHTLKQIGEIYGISAERVRQLTKCQQKN